MSSRPLYEPQEALGRVLKALREEKGLSQKEFASRIGLSSSWLSRIESGNYDPPWSNLRRVAKGLAITLGDLEDAVDSYEQSAESRECIK